MSSRPWPEGVPELPRDWPIRRYVLAGGRWRTCDGRYRSSEDVARVVAATETIGSPSVFRKGMTITHANAAARAIGILPDSEQEQTQ